MSLPEYPAEKIFEYQKPPEKKNWPAYRLGMRSFNPDMTGVKGYDRDYSICDKCGGLGRHWVTVSSTGKKRMTDCDCKAPALPDKGLTVN